MSHRPMFTQRHYEAIANLFKQERKLAEDANQLAEWSELLYAFADLFENDNPNFKEELFVKASGADI